MNTLDDDLAITWRTVARLTSPVRGPELRRKGGGRDQADRLKLFLGIMRMHAGTDKDPRPFGIQSVISKSACDVDAAQPVSSHARTATASSDGR